MANLAARLVEEASATLVDLFVWSDIEALTDPRFRQRRCEGVVMLDPISYVARMRSFENSPLTSGQTLPIRGGLGTDNGEIARRAAM